jgi:hypothetical protein
VDGKEPPRLLVQGLRNKSVSSTNAVSLAVDILAACGQVEYVTYPKRGHASIVVALAWPYQWLAPVLDDVTKYFNQH